MKNPVSPSALALALSAIGCSSAGPIDPVLTTRTESALGGGYFGLCCGTKSTLVEGIASAENLMFTSDGRLLVTGDDGIYDVVVDASGQATAVPLTPKETCKFSGLAEARGTLYAGCYDGTNSRVYAATLAPTLTFQSVASLPAVPLANGLAADSAGRIYVAETLKLRISRLTFEASDPLTLASQEVWLGGTGLATDGLKIFDEVVYWTDLGKVNRAAILPDGNASLASTLESGGSIFFDDLYVDTAGVLVANSLGGGLSAFNQVGLLIGKTPAKTFSEPSAVVPAHSRLGLDESDLVVTEKGANQVTVYHMN
jgi:hypothetical protein